MLSGDHIKSASDLDVPLVGVGLFYGQGYFRQRLDAAGWQREEYADVDLARLPLEPALGADGHPVMLEIETGDGMLHARVWRAAVGRRTLLLLDSDVEDNTPEDRGLTARLYGGDVRVRIRQELLLGIGGVRALHALGIVPGVLHLNEGHSAFAVLEMARRRIEREGVDFEQAIRRVGRRTVFTTHTPVAAGHDRFEAELVEEHLGPQREALGISFERLMSLGRVDPANAGEPFCMTVLGLKVSRRANAVSSLHGEVTRRMWMGLWSNRPDEEVPIGHVTNGIHMPSWLAPQMYQLYERNLPLDWVWHSGSPDVWEGIEKVSDAELWETHVALKIRLLDFVRRRIVREAQQRDEPLATVEQLAHGLSPDTLTIGFARRFATYKRAGLLFEDRDGLAAAGQRPSAPDPVRVRRQGASARRAGKARAAADLRVQPRPPGSWGSWSSSRTTTSTSAGISCRVWMCGSTIHAARRRHRGTSGQKVLLNGGAQSVGPRWLVGRSLRWHQRIRDR